MLRLYARISPTPPYGTPFFIAEATQMEAEARAWWIAIGRDTYSNDILIVDFPDRRQQDAVDFLAWSHQTPALMDVMERLTKGSIAWSMWSLENPARLLTPLNDEDRTFLKALRISFDEVAA